MSSDLVILSIIFFYTKRALERIAWTNMRALENCPQMEAPMQRSYSEPRNTRFCCVSKKYKKYCSMLRGPLQPTL